MRLKHAERKRKLVLNKRVTRGSRGCKKSQNESRYGRRKIHRSWRRFGRHLEIKKNLLGEPDDPGDPTAIGCLKDIQELAIQYSKVLLGGEYSLGNYQDLMERMMHLVVILMKYSQKLRPLIPGRIVIRSELFKYLRGQASSFGQFGRSFSDPGLWKINLNSNHSYEYLAELRIAENRFQKRSRSLDRISTTGSISRRKHFDFSRCYKQFRWFIGSELYSSLLREGSTRCKSSAQQTPMSSVCSANHLDQGAELPEESTRDDSTPATLEMSHYQEADMALVECSLLAFLRRSPHSSSSVLP